VWLEEKVMVKVFVGWHNTFDIMVKVFVGWHNTFDIIRSYSLSKNAMLNLILFLCIIMLLV